MAAITQAQLLEQLVGLTDAVKRLAEHTAPGPITTGVTEADRIRERVAFSYRALGTLTGRVSTTGTAFDVPVVGACRRRRFVLLTQLAPGSDFAELRTGTRSEVLRIHPVTRRPDRDDDIDALAASWTSTPSVQTRMGPPWAPRRARWHRRRTTPAAVRGTPTSRTATAWPAPSTRAACGLASRAWE